MTLKINPGCAIPELQTPSDLTAMLDKAAQAKIDAAAKAVIAQGAGANALAFRLAKGGIDLFIAGEKKAQDVVVKAAQSREAKRAVDFAEKQAARLAKYGSIPCPLPGVLDKAATGTVVVTTGIGNTPVTGVFSD